MSAAMDTAVTEATIAVRESPTRSSVGMLEALDRNLSRERAGSAEKLCI